MDITTLRERTPGGGVGPSTSGGALFAFWQAAYHLFGQWHARGGAQALVDALACRLAALGGDLRRSAPVARIDARDGRVHAIELEDGERIEARAVVTAIDPQLALLQLLDPPLGGEAGAELAAVRRGNVVQALVHVATTRLPPYPGARPGDWNGMQRYVDRLDDLVRGWAAAHHHDGVDASGGARRRLGDRARACPPAGERQRARGTPRPLRARRDRRRRVRRAAPPPCGRRALSRSSPIEFWNRLAPVYDVQLFLERPALRAAIALAAPGGDDRLLDVGTGTGAIPRMLAETGIRPAEAIGVDTSERMLEKARTAGLPKAWALERADARELPFDEDRFDLVFAAYLLNVLSDPDAEAALREMRRVAAPGGRVVVVTPVAPHSFLARPYELLWGMLERRLPRFFGGIRLLEPEPLVRAAGLEPEQRRYVGAGYPSVCLLAREGASG